MEQLLEWCMRMRKKGGRIPWLLGTAVGIIPLSYSKWILLKINCRRRRRLKRKKRRVQKKRRI